MGPDLGEPESIKGDRIDGEPESFCFFSVVFMNTDDSSCLRTREPLGYSIINMLNTMIVIVFLPTSILEIWGEVRYDRYFFGDARRKRVFHYYNGILVALWSVCHGVHPVGIISAAVHIFALASFIAR